MPDGSVTRFVRNRPPTTFDANELLLRRFDYRPVALVTF